jgi:hypothetical protein
MARNRSNEAIMFRLTLIALLFITSALAAAPKNFDVINAEVGVHDYTDRPTLCVLTLREVTTGKLVGLVEDIGDCYWTRQTRRYSLASLELPSHSLNNHVAGEMLSHLQAFDSQLEFFWSTAD